ncbi:MAG: hypothetical protein ACRDWY_06175 [Actinomycetes bacterium]
MTDDHAVPPAGRTVGRFGWLWGPAAILTVLVAGMVPLLFTTSYFWRGDTQIAYFGMYYHLGELLRQGQLPLQEPFAWRGGNHIVEGNFGLLSPIVMVIGIGATLTSNAIVYMTVWKLVFLGVAAGGSYLLTRSYGGPRPVAFVVGVLVPTCGFTMYLDAPTWLPGLVVSGLLAYVWWALRRSLLQGRNPFAPIVIGSLLATMGYVFGTVMLAVVICACIIDALLARRFAAALKGLAIGLLIGIPAAVARLPFVLSSAVTEKTWFDVRNTGVGATQLGDLVTSTLPTRGVAAPLFYVSWLLPFLVFVDWRTARRNSRDLVGLVLVWLVSLAWALAPSNMGPLRWPNRLMPYVVLCTVLLGAIVFSRARLRHLSGNRLLGALFITAFSAYASASKMPEYWRVQAAVAIAVAVGLIVLWLLLRRGPVGLPHRTIAVAAAFVGAWTVVLMGVQHHYAPQAFAANRGMPAAVTKYTSLLPAVVGDAFVVGSQTTRFDPDETAKPLVLIANSWYVTGRSIQNVHANTGFRAYSDRYCMSTFGLTCVKSLPTLLSIEPTTGLPRADLLSVSSIVLLTSDVPDAVSKAPPDGWHVADDSNGTVVWVRDHAMPSAGGVAWHTPGLDVVVTSRDNASVHLKVGNVPAGGGEIVFSRLAWPGYQVTNATVIDPVDKYLLAVHVSPDDANRAITIHYEPPHWTFLIRLMFAGIAIGLAWSLLAALTPRLRQRRTQPPAPEPAS